MDDEKRGDIHRKSCEKVLFIVDIGGAEGGKRIFIVLPPGF